MEHVVTPEGLDELLAMNPILTMEGGIAVRYVGRGLAERQDMRGRFLADSYVLTCTRGGQMYMGTADIDTALYDSIPDKGEYDKKQFLISELSPHAEAIRELIKQSEDKQC